MSKVVKIKLKLLLLSAVILLFFIGVAHAAEPRILFSDIDVKVGSKTDKNLRDGERVSEEAKPGDTVEFRIEVKSNFTSQDDIDVENVEVEVVIEEIDDGDDLDETAKDFDLRPGRDKRETLKFEVPLEVEEDDYEVIITAQGEDQNGTDHNIEMRLRLEVEKERHLLEITSSALSPAEVTCNRRNVQLSTNIINIGKEDEEDVKFHVSSPELGVDFTDEIGELTAEPNEDESKISKIYRFNVLDDADSGGYPIIFRALYNDGREKSEKTATLTVNDCIKEEPKATESGKEDKEEEMQEDVLVITPKTTGQTVTEVTQIPSNTVVTQESFLKSNAFIVGIIAAEIIAVIAGIVLVISLFMRKRS